MVMRWLACIGSCVMHAACAGSAAAPDALSIDAPVGGLTIELVALNGVPQMPTADVEITKVVLGATSIRAIGDAAPGDVRTTLRSYVFEWRDNLMPIPYIFRDAPPGVYSMVDLRVAASEVSADAVSIIGRARRSGNLVPFEIRSTAADVPIAVAIGVELVPRTISTASIQVDVASLVRDVDWDAIPLTADGRLSLADGDPEMAGVVAAVATAFSER